MTMRPRQPRPALAGDSPISHGAAVADGLNLDKIAQRALDISRATVPYLPVVGPAWEMAEDLQNGNYRGALFNGAMLAADLTPLGPARRAMKVANAINDMRRGAFLARAGTQTARIRKIENLGPGFEVHHTISMNGLGKIIPKASRKAEGLFRNHPANLKTMPKAAHRRLTGKWKDEATGRALERFNPVQRAWHGTNALQKTTALAAGATAADWGENLSRTSGAATGGKAANTPILDLKRPLDVKRTEQGFIISNRRQ